MQISDVWTAAAAAIPTVGLVAAAIWKSYREWRAVHPREDNWQDIEARSLERRRETLDRASEAYLDRLERDVRRLEEENEDLRFDRDRGWNLARWWETKAHELRHELANVLFITHMTERMPPRLPGLEEPEPKPAALSKP